ncbi:MAG TPA: PepSY domain-containing protein [Allosphingosinicella sp.]|nr:PepSY domain-containing protein [Allosphingosinicella sp.]
MTSPDLYRSVWRWHFFAGIIVLPVLAWMAVTGGLYLYKAEIERALYRDWIEAPASAAPLPVAAMVDAVQRQTGGRVTQVTRSAEAGDSWRMAFATGSGEQRMAFVRPDTGQVLGTTRAGGPMELVKNLHSLTVAGPAGNVLIEIVAGWAIILALTGFFLWWPRAGNRALSLAGKVGERRFWRNLHASAGALAGAVILFLAVTGMPWTIFWGAGFHSVVASQKIGRPAPPEPTRAHEDHESHLPWSVRGTMPPAVTGPGDVGPDRAVAAATARGLRTPWVLDLPGSPGRPYRVSFAAQRTGDVRIIYVDPATAGALQDVSSADFGPGARVFEWGIYTHQGQQYGEINRLVMLAGCIGMLLLALSAPVMWWKRRNGNGLRAPPRPDDPARARGALAIMLVVGLIFPLTGASMLVAMAVGWVSRRWRRA